MLTILGTMTKINTIRYKNRGYVVYLAMLEMCQFLRYILNYKGGENERENPNP